ncbi:MAG: arginase [Burkholderiaceae bacterium]|nr:arginase [Burkholderiaceae bacterium]
MASMSGVVKQSDSRLIELIAAQIGEGAQQMACKQGPDFLRQRSIAQELTHAGQRAFWGAAVESDAQLLAQGQLAVVEEYVPRLAQAVLDAVMKKHFPVVLGGDHSCAIATWSAIAKAYQAQGELGLIWIDAHLDSHSPDTSHSGAPHGMPLAVLLGHGPSALTDLYHWRGKFKPENVVVVGVRSYEPAEAELLKKLGVEIVSIEQVQKRSFASCLQEIISKVSRHTIGYGITFDLDALDPKDAPGVGSPVSNGMRLADTLEGLSLAAQDPHLVGFELVEYNPLLDDAAFTTAATCEALLKAVLHSR